MQNNYLENAMQLSAIITKHFGTKVSLVTPMVSEQEGYPWYGVSFVLYRTFKFVYEYERGFLSLHSVNPDKSGVCILLSDVNQKRINNRDADKGTIVQNLNILDEEVRLRLPDKFLEKFK